MPNKKVDGSEALVYTQIQMKTREDFRAATDEVLFAHAYAFSAHMDPGQRVNRIHAQWLMQELSWRRYGNGGAMSAMIEWIGSDS